MTPDFARSAFRRGCGALMAAVLVIGGCGGGGATIAPHVGMAVGTLVPDFALPDVNPASVSFSTDVAPSQHVGAASAWYFGHAT